MPTKPKNPAAPVAEPAIPQPQPARADKVETKPVKLPAKRAQASTAMVDQKAVMAELARRAAQVQATEKGEGVPYVSTKAGEFKFQDAVLDNPMRVILLDYSLANQYYGAAYDEDNPQPPVCAAVISASAGDEQTKAEDMMTPLAESPQRQADHCKDCPQNVFGSDSRGKGKACKNQRRLALVSCRDGAELEAIHETTDVVFLSVPPASLVNFKKYVKQVAKVKGLPPLGVITDVGIQKRAAGHELTFDFVADVPPAQLPIMLKLADSVQEQLLNPPNFEARESRKPKPAAKKPGAKAATRPAKFV